MHDLSLGPPAELKDQRSDLHNGPCFDGVYGCHLCWNAANGGNGTESQCDWCRERRLTKVVQPANTSVMYALCSDCQVKNEKARWAILDALCDDYWDYEDYEEEDY